MLLILACIEYGNLFKDNMSVNNASHDAAREGSSSGAFYDADYSILYITKKSLAVISASTDRVIVFKATAFSDTVPAACKSFVLVGDVGGVVGQCNIYSGSYVKNLSSSDRSSFGDTGAAPRKNDQYYPALNRQQARSGTKEYIGVYVVATYTPLTKMVPVPRLLESTTVIPIESRTA